MNISIVDWWKIIDENLGNALGLTTSPFSASIWIHEMKYVH